MTGADIGVGWIDSTGKMFFQVRYFIVYLSSKTRFLLFEYRIDMHLLKQNQSLIIQRKIGLLFKVDNKMDGQLFDLNVHLIHVISWTILSR